VSRNARHLDFVVPVAQPFTFPSLSSFEEAFEEALVASAAAEGLSPPTVAGIRYSLRRLTDFIRGRRLERAFLSGQLPEQARALEVWLGSLRAGGANHTTVNYYWRMLHAGLKRLGMRTGMAEPTQFLPVPRPGRPLPRFLSRTDLEAVLRAAANYQWPRGPFERHRSVAIIAMMGLGGLRRGEVLRLEVRDIDLTQGAVTVRHGKGRSGGKDRVVFMPPGLRTALSSYLDVRAARPGSTGRLFLSTRGTRPIGVTTIRRLCRTLQEASGVAVAPHMLRHTCATLLRQAGIPDRLAMEQLGHASLGVLQRYSHVTDEERRQIVGRLDVDLMT
jgi:integrase/recombinase XerD